ncbi:hypothetical protein ACFFSH_39895 [Streptomyces filamentosus]|nr:hypothetical protein [Streptomyces filamentosus]
MSAADRAAHEAASYVRRQAAAPLSDKEREELSRKLAERNKNSRR